MSVWLLFVVTVVCKTVANGDKATVTREGGRIGGWGGRMGGEGWGMGG